MVLACVVSAVLGVVAYAPSMHNKFVYDDWYVVVKHPSINIRAVELNPRPWYRIWVEPYWPSSPDKLYRPLTILSLRVNAWLSPYPLEAGPFRAVNILLHVLTSVGVVVLGRRLTGSIGAGLLAGMLFATHPVHTEAVVPIYGRSELLAAMFGVWLLARHIRPPAAVARDALVRSRTPAHIVLSGLLLAAAVMSKESAVFLWPVLMAIDLWHRRNRELPSSRLPLREWLNTTFAPSHIAFALAVATFLFFRYLVFGWQTHMEGSRTRIYEVPMAHVGPIEHLLTPFRLLWLVVVNLVWPDSLCPIWSYPQLSPAGALEGDVLAGIALAVAMVTAIVVWWRRGVMAGALLAGLLVTLAIPVQAIPVARWFYAERWLYSPTVLVAVLAAWAVHRLGRPALVAGFAVALVLLPPSWQYASKFVDDYTMAREVTVRQPNNYQGRRNYAAILYLQRRYPEAVQAANQMLQRFGPVSDAYMTLAKSYVELKDGKRAMEAIRTYEALGIAHLGQPLDVERERALALLAAQRPASSGPATSSAPASAGADVAPCAVEGPDEGPRGRAGSRASDGPGTQ